MGLARGLESSTAPVLHTRHTNSGACCASSTVLHIPHPVPLRLTLPLSRGGDALSLNHLRSGSLHSGCMANARRHFLLALVAAPRCQALGLDPCSDGYPIGALRRDGGGGQPTRPSPSRTLFSWRRRKNQPRGDLAISGPSPPPTSNAASVKQLASKTLSINRIKVQYNVHTRTDSGDTEGVNQPSFRRASSQPKK